MRPRSVAFPVALDEGLGRLAVEEEEARHVDQLVRQLLLTAPGERVNRPAFGCGLRAIVFAPNGDVTAGLAQVTIYQALREWLDDLIEVRAVDTAAVGERLEIRVAYALRSRGEERVLDLEVIP